MRVAATLSGQPRFTKEFDVFLENLQDYDEVDWFVYLWNNFEESERVPPFMLDPNNWNEETMRDKFEANLPANHRVVYFGLHEIPPYEVTRPLNTTPWTHAPGVWYMHLGLKAVTEIREQYEQEHGKYDLVVRARPDVMIYPRLSLAEVNDYIKQNPKTLIMSANHRLGLQGRGVSELMFVANSDTMSTVCKMFDHLFEYNDAGVPYHPETLTAHHLTVNGIDTPMTNFEMNFRTLKQPDGTLDWGRWN